MTKLVKKTNKNITISSNHLIRDSRLSWKARGIFMYLWSLPNDWKFHENEISNHSTDGINCLNSGIKELQKYGYLNVKRERNKFGQMKESHWLMNDNPDLKNSNLVNSNFGNSNFGNHQLLNTNNTKHLSKQNTDSTNLPQSKSENEFADINHYVEKNWTVTIPVTKRKKLTRLMCKHSYQSIIKAINIAIDNGIGIKGLVGYITSVLSNDQKPKRHHKEGNNHGSKYDQKITHL